MKTWIIMALVGILFIIGGIVSLANPLPATLAAGGLVAWTFLLTGLLVLFGSWQAKKWTERLVLLALGIVVTVIGWSLISNPLVGIVRLTYVVAILFVASGFAKVVAAFWYRIPPFFWVLLLSGLVSVLIGALTLANFPQSAAVMLGLLLSVELFSNGLAMFALAIILKRAA